MRDLAPRCHFYLLAVCLWAAAVPGCAATCAAGQRSYRSGTIADPGGRVWAVIRDCRHPEWPAHLAPASEWDDLPALVPQGASIAVALPGTAATLSGKTVAPAHVGEAVAVKIVNGAQIRVRLTSAAAGRIETGSIWRRP